MPDSASPVPAHSPRESTWTRVRGDGTSLPPLLPPLENLDTTDLPPSPSKVPSSPPPSYEEVLAENRLVAAAHLARTASMEAAAAASETAGASGGSCADTRGAEKSPVIPLIGRGPLQIQHKSSKALYRAVAAQWGLTCKMSDKCRCFDCQGRYFDFDFDDQNENEKASETGLSVTTPMFISEVLGGSACTLL